MYNGQEHERNTYWAGLIDDFGRELITALGYDPDWLPTDHNLIATTLKNGTFGLVAGPYIADKNLDKRFNRNSIVRLATILQMVVYDANNGPEEDGRPKGIRRHWYAWYKTRIAQPFSRLLGDDLQARRWKLNWFGRLSETLKKMVDRDGVTYLDLWVRDASRMIEAIGEVLFRDLNLVVAIEKDSLVEDFTRAARSLGAKVVISGKGKPSAAATELMLRDHFNWPGYETYNTETYQTEFREPFGPDKRLIIIEVTDWDEDGRVIGNTFSTQARRYTEHILTARVGINPEHLDEKGHDIQDAMYEVAIKKNVGYERWIQERAIFYATCPEGETRITMGTGNECPEHNVPFEELDYWGVDIPYGFEVEAMRTQDYRSLLVDALLRVVPFEVVLQKLREDATANPEDAVYNIRQRIVTENESLTALEEEIERLRQVESAFENEVYQALYDIANSHKGDFADEGDDPPQEEFVAHVERDNYGPWRPFDTYARTQLLEELLEDIEEDEIDRLIGREVVFTNRQTGRVTVVADDNGTDRSYGFIRRDEDSAELVYFANEAEGFIGRHLDVEFTPVEGLNGLTAVNVVML